MTGRIDKRIVVWGVAAIALAAAFLLAYASLSDAAEDSVVDTGATVSTEQCSPCHADLSSVDVPGLIFSHGNHLRVNCDACHSRMPHRDGTTESVPMESCFACHGVYHGEQGELATGDCSDCHTSDFDLRPESHVDDWAGEPHAQAADESGVNDCMMCHDAPTDCDSCHEKQAPDVPPMPIEYHSVVYPRDKGPSIKIDVDGGVSISQCEFCHPDLDAFDTTGLTFAHADHLRRNYSCESCHPTFPHKADKTEKSDMLSCYRCHGLEHATQGAVATEDCGKCHPKSFDLKPADHTDAFVKGTHKKRAVEQPEYCSMCHKTQFCIDCHNGEGTSPSAPSKPVVPTDHKDAKWRSSHGKKFLNSEGLCGVCHTGPSCQECHKTVVPHTAEFIADHRPPAGVTDDDCWICHENDRNECQSCHHENIKTADLVEENCVKCHEEMKQKPATSIKNKGYAEHAVHFDVAKTKGKPYKCYDCHVDFGSSKAARTVELQQGHDLRLCYDCHGALDPLNRQIAPYEGAALCLRCHTDVGV